MNREKIEINVELKEKMIEEYFAKMNLLKQRNLMILVLLMIIVTIMSINYKNESFVMFYI